MNISAEWRLVDQNIRLFPLNLHGAVLTVVAFDNGVFHAVHVLKHNQPGKIVLKGQLGPVLRITEGKTFGNKL